jgi:hypothetical protein
MIRAYRRPGADQTGVDWLEPQSLINNGPWRLPQLLAFQNANWTFHYQLGAVPSAGADRSAGSFVQRGDWTRPRVF